MTYLVRLDFSATEYAALLLAIAALEERARYGHARDGIGQLLKATDEESAATLRHLLGRP